MRAAATEANSDSFERPFVVKDAELELEAPSLHHPTQAPLRPTARTVVAIGKAKGAFRHLGLRLECLSALSVAVPSAEATSPASAPFFTNTSLPP